MSKSNHCNLANRIILIALLGISILSSFSYGSNLRINVWKTYQSKFSLVNIGITQHEFSTSREDGTCQIFFGVALGACSLALLSLAANIWIHPSGENAGSFRLATGGSLREAMLPFAILGGVGCGIGSGYLISVGIKIKKKG